MERGVYRNPNDTGRPNPNNAEPAYLTLPMQDSRTLPMKDSLTLPMQDPPAKT